MANLNRVMLIGNLTRDPEVRYTPGGTAVAGFGIAVNRRWKDQHGETKSEVCFVDVVMFGSRGEAVNEYLHKGDPIFIEGRLQFNQWETKDGQKRSALKVVGEQFQFIGGNRESTGSTQNQKTGEPDITNEDVPF